jgi:hypothetical protein
MKLLAFTERYSATGNGNGYEARKAFEARKEALLAELANSKPFPAPTDARHPASTPADFPPPVSVPNNSQSETHSNSQDDYRMDNTYRTSSAFMQVESQRKHEEGKEEGETGKETDNFLQKYVNGEEEEEGEKNGKLVDYLLKALEGKEEELRAEGNSYMSAEEKEKYFRIHFPGLFNPQ